MVSVQSTVLSFRGVSLSGSLLTGAARAFDFDLGHGEVALVEYNDDGDAEDFVDVCLGLVEPASGEVHCLGEPWRGQSYHAMLAHRRRIGSLVGVQAWPGHVPVAEVVLASRLYHTRELEETVLAQATDMARRFGLPGLPTGGHHTVRLPDLARAACVSAFIGQPELVVILDRLLEGMPELSTPMAQAIGGVQDRGGAVLWLLGSLAAPAARSVAADHQLRLRDRGIAPIIAPARRRA